MVKIESIKYGWFEIRFGNHYIDCSDYLGNDIPKRFLKAAYDLLVKKTELEWICWDDEPGASIMNLELLEDKILITVYSALQPSYDLFRSSKPLKESCGEQEWSEMLDASSFVDDLVTEFALYKDGTGLLIYEKNWMPFPEKEFAALKAYAVELSKTMGKYERTE